MIAGLFLGLLLSLSCVLWILLRQRQENILNSTVIAATNCSVLVTDARVSHHPIVSVNSAFLVLTGYAEQDVIGAGGTHEIFERRRRVQDRVVVEAAQRGGR